MRVGYVYIVQMICATLLFCWYCTGESVASKSLMHFDHSAPKHFSEISKYSRVSNIVEKEDAEKKKHKRTRVVRASSVIVPIPEIIYIQADLPPLFSKYEFPIAENYFYLFCKEINPPPPKSC